MLSMVGKPSFKKSVTFVTRVLFQIDKKNVKHYNSNKCLGNLLGNYNKEFYPRKSLVREFQWSVNERIQFITEGKVLQTKV